MYHFVSFPHSCFFSKSEYIVKRNQHTDIVIIYNNVMYKNVVGKPGKAVRVIVVVPVSYHHAVYYVVVFVVAIYTWCIYMLGLWIPIYIGSDIVKLVEWQNLFMVCFS